MKMSVSKEVFVNAVVEIYVGKMIQGYDSHAHEKAVAEAKSLFSAIEEGTKQDTFKQDK